MTCLWRRKWKTAAFYFIIPVVLFWIGNGPLWGAVMLFLLNVLTYGVLATSRVVVGGMTPDTLERRFGVRLSQLLRPGTVVKIPDTDPEFLNASVRELNKIDAYELHGSKPLAIIYIQTDGIASSQEGLDMGGLYRDWLNRAAEKLLDPIFGAFHVATKKDGTEMLRLRDDISVELATFTGRLLALSLKANVAFGWALSEPLAKLLLHSELPDLLAATSKTVPSSKWQKIKGRVMPRAAIRATWHETLLKANAEYNPKTWILAACGEWEAQRFWDCTDEGRPREERQTLLDQVQDVWREEGGPVVTLESLPQLMDRRVKAAFLHDRMRYVWEALREVPDVKPPFETLRPKHCHTFMKSVFGLQTLEIPDWKANTKTVLPASVSTEMVQQLIEWFWQFIEDLDQTGRSEFFFWASSLKRLPSGGWQKLKMTLQITRDTTRLPVAHTCAFQIDLPVYNSQEILIERLRIAMGHTKFNLA